MKSLYKKGVEAQFKKVPEGWSFQGPSPWILSAAPSYVVNDAQKAKIIEAHPSGGLVSAFFSMVTLFTLASMMLYSDVVTMSVFGHAPSTFLETWLIPMLMFVLLAVVPAIGYRLLVAHRLRFVVAERPQTRRIPLADSFSEETLHVMCIAFAVGSALISFVYIVCIILVAIRFTGMETYGLFVAAFCSECLTLYLYALLLLRPNERRESK